MCFFSVFIVLTHICWLNIGPWTVDRVKLMQWAYYIETAFVSWFLLHRSSMWAHVCKLRSASMCHVYSVRCVLIEMRMGFPYAGMVNLTPTDHVKNYKKLLFDSFSMKFVSLSPLPFCLIINFWILLASLTRIYS